MKCSACGHVFHGADSTCNTVGCSCSGGEKQSMSDHELASLSLDEFVSMRAALAEVVPPDDSVAPEASPPDVDGSVDSPNGPVTDTSPPAGNAGDMGTPDGTMDGPAFVIPVGIIEGLATSDGRMLGEGSTTWRDTPFPLMGIDRTMPEHLEAEIVGRVDEVFRDGSVIGARGVFLGNDRGAYFAQLVGEQFIKGVSADLTDVVEELIVTAVDDDGFPAEVGAQFSQAVIAGFTICPFPAFAGAYIVLDTGEAEAAPPPPTLEQPTPEQAAMGLHVLDDAPSRCGTCDENAPLVASAGPMYPPRSWFENPTLDGPTRLTIDDDGRIFGHLAVFGTCHIGMQGNCVTPYKSASSYSHFATGAVLTSEGELVATGVITMDTGHADTDPKMTAAAARAHYDNTGHAVADVAMGHDEFGIWISGAMRPDVDELSVRRLRGSALSGDWRWIGSTMEVVAALAVNVPGFPVPQATIAGGHPVALIAAGGQPLARIAEAHAGGESSELAQRLAVVERLLSLNLEGARDVLRARMAALTS